MTGNMGPRPGLWCKSGERLVRPAGQQEGRGQPAVQADSNAPQIHIPPSLQLSSHRPPNMVRNAQPVTT